MTPGNRCGVRDESVRRRHSSHGVVNKLEELGLILCNPKQLLLFTSFSECTRYNFPRTIHESCLQDFLEILKLPLQNLKKILKIYSLILCFTTSIVYVLYVALYCATHSARLIHHSY